MTDMDRAALAKELIRDEGLRLKPYRDTVGVLTVGVGRNLDHVGLSLDEVHHMLSNDIVRVCDEIDEHFPWVTAMNGVRQRAFANLLFNLGLVRLKKFAPTLALMEAGDFAGAAARLRKTLWFKQVKERGPRVVAMFETGEA